MNIPSEADVGSVDEYIASFYQGASLDSQGHFTVDLERRLTKLAKYQLDQPEKFVLALVTAVTLGGASYIRWARTPAGFALKFDGEVCSADELRQLQVALEQQSVDPGQPRMRHLQVALNLVRNLHHGRVTLQLSGGQALQVPARGPIGIKETDKPQGLFVEGAAWGLLNLLFSSRISRSADAVQKLLGVRCSRGPARLVNAGAPISWVAPAAALQIGAGPPEPLDYPAAAVHGHVHLSGYRGVLLLGNADSGSQEEAVLISAGVSYNLPLLRQRDQAPLQLLLWTESAVPDLSYQAPLEEPIAELLRQIPMWIGELEAAHLASVYSQGGIEAVLADPGAARVLWNYRQRARFTETQVDIRWDQGRHTLAEILLPGAVPISLAVQMYRDRQHLPVTHEEGLVLDDGSPAVLRTSEKENRLADLLFPRQRVFLPAAGRAFLARATLTQLLDPPSFWQITGLTQDCQVGLNLKPSRCPALLCHYQGFSFTRVEEAGIGLPPGTTLASNRPGKIHLEAEQLGRLLGWLYKAAWQHPDTFRNPQRYAAVLHAWLLGQLHWTLHHEQLHAVQHGVRRHVGLQVPCGWTRGGECVPLEQLPDSDLNPEHREVLADFQGL